MVICWGQITHLSGHIVNAGLHGQKKRRKLGDQVCLNPKINQVKSPYYREATTTNKLRKVDSFFGGLESCVGVLEENAFENDRFQGVQQLLPSHRMVVNVPCKLHNRIIRLPRPTLRLADPWSGEFSLDLPMVLFTTILTEIIFAWAYND